MPLKIPEMRCPVCGSLYNVAPCVETTHVAVNARKSEREKIVTFFIEEASHDTSVVAAAVEAIAEKLRRLP